MYNELLTLKDGTEINVFSGFSDGFLWLWFTGYTMQEAATIFLDESKTESFTVKVGENETEYAGLTDCRLIQRNAEGKLSVCLTRGAQNG